MKTPLYEQIYRYLLTEIEQWRRMVTGYQLVVGKSTGFVRQVASDRARRMATMI